MNTEKQIQQAVTSPEIVFEAGSSESKRSKRGGKRPGAGRKPNPVKILLKGVHRETINAAVQDIDVGSVISQLLKSKREIIQLQTLNFIFDRLLGKPKQELGISGGLVHAHTRDPRLASLSNEALEALARAYDDVLVRYSPAVLAVQDGPHNQIESNRALLPAPRELEAND
jgi:hypothetical protein